MRKFITLLLGLCILLGSAGAHAEAAEAAAKPKGETWTVEVSLTNEARQIAYEGQLEVQLSAAGAISLWAYVPDAGVDHRLYADAACIQFKLPQADKWNILMTDEQTPLTPLAAVEMLSSALESKAREINQSTEFDADALEKAGHTLLEDVTSNPSLLLLQKKFEAFLESGAPLHLSTLELGMLLDTLLLSISQNKALATLVEQVAAWMEPANVLSGNPLHSLFMNLRSAYRYSLFNSTVGLLDATLSEDQLFVRLTDSYRKNGQTIDVAIRYPGQGFLTVDIKDIYTRDEYPQISQVLYAEAAAQQNRLVVEGFLNDYREAFLVNAGYGENSLDLFFSTWNTYDEAFQAIQLELAYDTAALPTELWKGQLNGSLTLSNTRSRFFLSDRYEAGLTVTQSPLDALQPPPENATPLRIPPEVLTGLF